MPAPLVIPAALSIGSGLARALAANTARQWGAAFTGRTLAAKQLSVPTIATSFGLEAVEDANDFNIPEVTPSGLIGSNAYYGVKNIGEKTKNTTQDYIKQNVIPEIANLLQQKANNTYQQFTALQKRVAEGKK